jgi:hypothetical protein
LTVAAAKNVEQDAILFHIFFSIALLSGVSLRQPFQSLQQKQPAGGYHPANCREGTVRASVRNLRFGNQRIARGRRALKLGPAAPMAK